MLQKVLLYLFLLPALQSSAQKPAENIFIKTDISRTTCFLGEPVLVTFTLYSAGPAIASGQRSPAFYGFSIVDLINYKEPVSGVAEWKGKMYATSILRKVLLYPVQSGKLFVDPMYIETIVEAFDSIQNEKTELEKEVVSRPIEVTVLPLPGRPVNFTGAVGSFLMEAELKPFSFSLNQQGKLVVELKGNGNFINAGQPLVTWPPGVEGFESSVKENLNKTDSGIYGARIYEFAFTVNAPGKFELPPIQFTYFDPRTSSYKFIVTDSLGFEVYPAQAINEKIIATGKQNSPLVLAVLFILLLGALAFLWVRRKNKNRQVKDTGHSLARIKFDPPYTLEALLSRNEAEICTALMQALGQFITRHQNDVSREEIAEASFIKKELQSMLYSNSLEKRKLKELAERCYHLFERDHSAYL